MSSHLKDFSQHNWDRKFYSGIGSFPVVLHFGAWRQIDEDEFRFARTNVQYNAFEICFRGPEIRWIGTKDVDHGFADVYTDGEFLEKVDTYAKVRQTNSVLFRRGGLSNDRVHTLRVVVRKERNPKATDCFQELSHFQAEEAVLYPLEISNAMAAEYALIQAGEKEILPPETWKPVANMADPPSVGGSPPNL